MKTSCLNKALRIPAESTIELRAIDAINTFVFLILLFQSQINKLLPDVSTTVEKIASYFPMLMAFMILSYSVFKKKNSQEVRDGREIIKMYLPYFILVLLSVMLAVVCNSFAISIYGMKYWTRFFDKLLLRISFIIIVVCSWTVNKKNCVKTLKNAVILDGILILLLAIRQNGFAKTALACIAPLGLAEENEATGILEIHEATFVIGLLLLYYLFNFPFKENKRTIIVLTILFIIGGKRIAFGAMLVALIAGLFIVKSKKKMPFYLIALGLGIMCFIQLWLLYSGNFFEYIEELGINLNNRDLIYGFFLRRSELKPLYFGWGFSAVSRVIENMRVSEVKWMVVVRGLHCDILKQYLEFGFLGFLFWLYFTLAQLPSMLNRKFGMKCAKMYMILIVYAFVTYMTDNTEGYFLFQSTLLLLSLAPSKLENNKERIVQMLRLK